jgi:DNA-binding transcriptional ArsR family regulator
VRQSADSVDEVADLFRALGSPVRLALLAHLESGAATVTELVAALGASQPLVSQHLRVLRQHRLVASVRRGQSVVYEITDEHVSHIIGDAIAHLKEKS